jgi:hypothetical protein
MNDGDLYLRDGADYQNGVYYPEAPIAQVEEEQKAIGIKASSYPVMDDVANWFKEAIADCDSISNIETSIQTLNGVKYSRTISIEGQVFAYQLLKELLQDKANEFQEFGEGRV